MSRGDDRIDDVCRHRCGDGEFDQILGTCWAHGIANSAGGRSGLQTVTTSKKTTHEVPAGLHEPLWMFTECAVAARSPYREMIPQMP
jgi:hypothetical protein